MAVLSVEMMAVSLGDRRVDQKDQQKVAYLAEWTAGQRVDLMAVP